MGFIRDWIYKHFYVGELTPKGECFYNYVKKHLEEDSNESIEDYEETIEVVKGFMEDLLDEPVSRKDALEFLDDYINEKYF